MSVLAHWYSTTSLGQLLKTAEAEALAASLQNIFGYYLLMTGCGDGDMLNSSRVRNRIVLVDKPEPCAAPAICGKPEKLPIVTDSLDAVVLYHTLDFTDDPHQVLREADRVLVPEGHIVILGFNPHSTWGLSKWLRWRRQGTPWSGRFVSSNRVRDWLNLLGFECLSTTQTFFRWPVNHAGFQRRTRFFETVGRKVMPWSGAVYLITARKKESTLTPIKPRWRPRDRVVAGLLDTASRNNSSH